MLLQNGMGTLEQLQGAFPFLRCLVGSTTHGVYPEDRTNGTFVHAGFGQLWVGMPRAAAYGGDAQQAEGKRQADDTSLAAELQAVCSSLEQCGLGSELSLCDDIR